MFDMNKAMTCRNLSDIILAEMTLNHLLPQVVLTFMQERDIFDERQEVKKASFSCPHCRERADYDVRWMKRTKKKNAPKNLNDHERSQYAKSRDYMVRMDDMLSCSNMRCRKRFEIPSSQSVVFI